MSLTQIGQNLKLLKKMLYSHFPIGSLHYTKSVKHILINFSLRSSKTNINAKLYKPKLCSNSLKGRTNFSNSMKPARKFIFNVFLYLMVEFLKPLQSFNQSVMTNSYIYNRTLRMALLCFVYC